MKIIEVVKEWRTRSEMLRSGATDNNNGGFLRGRATAYDECADMLEETVREIQEELNKVKADAKSGDFAEEFRTNAAGMVVMLEWVLGEDRE